MLRSAVLLRHARAGRKSTWEHEDALQRRELRKGEAVALTWDDCGVLSAIRWIDRPAP